MPKQDRLRKLKCPSCLYLEATYLNFCVKGPVLLFFRGDALIQVQHFPSDQTMALQKLKLINMKNALLRVSLRNKA
jgi:hypothetical protein